MKNNATALRGMHKHGMLGYAMQCNTIICHTNTIILDGSMRIGMPQYATMCHDMQCHARQCYVMTCNARLS
eukprot:5047524-Pyramimonas_sp.AAC.1